MKRGLLPIIVEAEPVDHGAVGHRAEHARAGIAGLRARRQRADFDEAEAHGEQLARHARILVETRRHADRIRNVQPEQMLAEALVVRFGGARIKPELQTFDRDFVRPFGRQRQQQALAQAEQPAHANTPSGRIWLPSSASVSGSVHSTVARSSGA